jgi:hypothetical protein
MNSLRRIRTPGLLGAALVLALGLSSSAAGAFERQWRLGGGLGGATLDGAGLGPAVGVHGGYGLSDMFDLQLELVGSRHRGQDAETDVVSASAGISYKVDVFEWIPYVLLTGGAYHYGGDVGPNGEAGLQAGASVGVGLDYMWSRAFAVGVQLRQHTSFSDGVAFSYRTGLLRAEYRWGW